MYIPYLYFKVKPESRELEKSCIEIITKGEKDLSKYIQSIIHKENEYYIIDTTFWNLWGCLCGWSHNDVDNKKDVKLRDQKPRINLTSLLEYSGKLDHSLKYKKDYLILSKR